MNFFIKCLQAEGKVLSMVGKIFEKQNQKM